MKYKIEFEFEINGIDSFSKEELIDTVYSLFVENAKHNILNMKAQNLASANMDNNTQKVIAEAADDFYKESLESIDSVVGFIVSKK